MVAYWTKLLYVIFEKWTHHCHDTENSLAPEGHELTKIGVDDAAIGYKLGSRMASVSTVGVNHGAVEYSSLLRAQTLTDCSLTCKNVKRSFPLLSLWRVFHRNWIIQEVLSSFKKDLARWKYCMSFLILSISTNWLLLSCFIKFVGQLASTRKK